MSSLTAIITVFNRADFLRKSLLCLNSQSCRPDEVIISDDGSSDDLLQALMRILTEPRNALVKQYQRLFSLDNTELVFTPDALQAAADEAIKLKTGARGLRTILESVLLDVMYEIPSRPEVTKCVVNADTIVRHSQPVPLAGGERAVLWGIEPKEAA